MKPPPLTLAVFIVYFCCLPIPAQTPAATSPADGIPTIRMTKKEVALDLVVRDKKGHIVRDLDPASVEIYL
jgi:hypothetical protein